MRKKNGVRWDLLLFVMFLFLCNVSSTADLEGSLDQSGVSDNGSNEIVSRIAGTPHSPIAIDGDGNFSDTALAEGWLGDGSQDLPYIIEGFDVDVGGGGGYCIMINNTRVHFVVRDCLFTGADVAIYINNVTDGELVHNICSNNNIGMDVGYCNSTLFADNTCYDNSNKDINLLYSNFNNLSSNVLYSTSATGINLEYSSFNNLNNNILWDNGIAILLMYSHSNRIVNTTCTNTEMSSIMIYFSDGLTVLNNTCINSQSSGIHLQYSSYSTVVDNTCNDNDHSGIYLFDVDFGVVANNTCNQNYYGLYLLGISDYVVSNNEANYNEYEGMRVFADSNTTVIANECGYTNIGPGIIASGSITLENNLCIQNLQYGIYIGSTGSCIIRNNTCNEGRSEMGSPTTYGIYLAGGDSNIMVNNTCLDNTGPGIYLQGFASSVVADNVCFDNDGAGIWARSLSESAISNNNCSSNAYGIYLESSVNCSMVNNICNDNDLNGISLDMSDSNNVTENSCFSNFQAGIHLSNSDSNDIADNICSGNDKGVYLGSSHYNSIINNTCTLNGDSSIHLVSSITNTVANNTCFSSIYGLYLQSSGNNSVRMNTFLECGLFITGDPAQCDQWQVTDNTVNSRPLVFVEGQTGVIVGSGAGQIILLGCFEMTIENQNLSSCTVGLLLLFVDLVFVWENIFSSCNYGIYIYGAQVVFIENNVFSQNSYGISINDDMDHLANVDVSWNTFFENHIENAVEFAVGFITFDHNYWSDYTGPDVDSNGIGDIPYTFTGNSDPLPLMYSPIPPVWQELPTNQMVEYDFNMLSFRYNLKFIAYSPLSWQINSTQFTIYEDGAIVMNSMLPIGVYGLEVTASNPYSTLLVGSFSVHIFDTTPPSWVSIPVNQSLFYGEPLDIQISVVDLSGISRWELNDTVRFRMTTIYGDTSSIARITSSSILEPGEYGLNVTCFDIFDNRKSAVFTVTVEAETTSPFWVLAPIDETVEFGEPYVQRLGAYDSSGIDHWWLNDTVYFTIDGNGVVRNATVLESGIYRLEVRAYDPFENYCSATLVITVLELPTTTTTTATTTSTTTTTTTTTDTTTTGTAPDGVDPVLTLVLGTGIGGVAVVIIVIVFLRRKS